MDPELSKRRFHRSVRPLVETPDIYRAAGLRLVEASYPMLTVALTWHRQNSEILLRVDASDWDYRPPRGWWLDADGNVLQPGSGLLPSGPGFQQGSDPYGDNRPWFCFRGWSEYHDHTSHAAENWAAYRGKGGFGLLGLIAQLHTDLNRAEVTAA
jgi:hypothetical protein